MHQIIQLLVDLGISSEDSFEDFFPVTRDNENVGVLRCKKSGVIVLNSIEHMSAEYYEKADTGALWNMQDMRMAVVRGEADNQRRKKKFAEAIINKKWLDFGAGAGGILKAFQPFAKQSFGVELHEGSCDILRKEGFEMAGSIKDFPDNDFEVVTLFHVAEHLIDPIETMKDIYHQMKPGGKIIVEVPHAGDALITLFKNEAFKKFTFWSQHLVLHTRQSLQKFVEAAGFKNVVIEGVQRYPLSNHLHWLARNKPGGHTEWPFLNQDILSEAYEKTLQSIDMTDTIVLTAEK